MATYNLYSWKGECWKCKKQTSRVIATEVSGYCLQISSTSSTFLEDTPTKSPIESAFKANSLPNPEEHPDINQMYGGFLNACIKLILLSSPTITFSSLF